MGNFNAYSQEWNLHYRERRYAVVLETLIEKYDLILNHQPAVVIKLTWDSMTSIIDLIFTTSDIGVLDTWVIDNELSKQ